MFRLLSLLSVYFLSQMFFKDLVKKLLTPFVVSTSVGLIRFTTKMAVLVLAGTALLTLGFVFTVMELVRIGSIEPFFAFTPTLISGLIFLGIGLSFVGLATLSQVMVPKMLRVNPKDQAVFMDSMLGVVQNIIRDMERKAPEYQGPPPRPETRPPGPVEGAPLH